MMFNKELKPENYEDLVPYLERCMVLREKITTVADEMAPLRQELCSLPTVLDAEANIAKWEIQVTEAKKNPTPDNMALKQLEEQIATFRIGIARRKELVVILKQLSIKLKPLQKEQQQLFEDVRKIHKEFELELKQKPLRLEALKSLVVRARGCGTSISQADF